MKNRFYYAVSACLALGLLTGCGKKDNVAEMNRVYIETATAYSDKAFKNITYVGSIVAKRVSNIYCEIRGIVTKIHFKPGVINKGDLLYEIKSDEIDGGLTKAEAVYKEQKALYERYEKIYSHGGCTEMEYQQVLSRFKQSEGEYQAARGRLNQRMVRADISGVIGLSRVRVGNQVGFNGSTLMASIVDDKEVEIDFEIDQSIALEVSKIRDVGSVRVYIFLDEISIPVEAELVSVDTEPDASTKMFLCRAVIADNKVFTHGQSVKVLLQIYQGEGVFVPATSVVTDDSGRSYVFVVDGGIAQAVYVKLNKGVMKSNGDVQVLGLKPGAKVVIAGQYRLSSSFPNPVVDSSDTSIPSNPVLPGA